MKGDRADDEPLVAVLRGRQSVCRSLLLEAQEAEGIFYGEQIK